MLGENLAHDLRKKIQTEPILLTKFSSDVAKHEQLVFRQDNNSDTETEKCKND